MSKISAAFARRKAFIAFITGGDPDIETTARLIEAIAEAGADLIEIGIPFSDPIAEGPIIQAADERALAAGCTTDKLFEMVSEISSRVSVPLLFMTYINPIYTYGKKRFLKRCAETGIAGIIVPDMPFEEKDELTEECTRYGVELVSLISPTSDERIFAIARESEGFVYCVSSLGVTGVRGSINTNIAGMISKVRSVSNTPCAVGFGVSTPEQAAVMSKLADGVIVGSAIVRIIAKYGQNAIEPVRNFINSMRHAIDQATSE